MPQTTEQPLLKTVVWQDLSPAEQTALYQRPAITDGADIQARVADIVNAVKTHGDRAVADYTQHFDGADMAVVSADSIATAGDRLGADVKTAMDTAYANITAFHTAQKHTPITVETQTGIICECVTRPLSAVGLYIPGGSAPLPSTVLMLGVPAQLAGCDTVVLCSPPPIADEILYGAFLCGINTVIAVGGSQAIAGMAYGTDTIPRVDKVFGPGNAYVTQAKRQVSADINGCAIDMPAGPSEVLVIADTGANADFIATDLLSQAEHGADSQVVLVTPCADLPRRVNTALADHLKTLPRAKLALGALSHSVAIVAPTLDDCVNISNAYAPEHLIIQTQNPRAILPQIAHAGSVFLGAWSPESVGDYASGTNHVLPTYGYARTHSSLGLADFSKRMTVQELTPQGLANIAPTVTTLAHAEGLHAHARAVDVRMGALENVSDGSE